jgi:hypothetical protein
MKQKRGKFDTRVILPTCVAGAVGVVSTALLAIFTTVLSPMLAFIGVGACAIGPIAYLGTRFFTWLGSKGVEGTTGWKGEGEPVKQEYDADEGVEEEIDRESYESSSIDSDAEEDNEDRDKILKGAEGWIDLICQMEEDNIMGDNEFFGKFPLNPSKQDLSNLRGKIVQRLKQDGNKTIKSNIKECIYYTIQNIIEETKIAEDEVMETIINEIQKRVKARVFQKIQNILTQNMMS